MDQPDSSLQPEQVALTLAANARLFPHLIAGLDAQALTWKSGATSWSLLECLHHMLDEERLDFRVRVRLLLEDASQPWPAIDPESWAQAAGYNQQDPGITLKAFLAERSESVRWLRSLGQVNLELKKEHPKLGHLAVGDLLCSWLAHDLLHLKQMLRQRLALLKQFSSPYTPAYAGA